MNPIKVSKYLYSAINFMTLCCLRVGHAKIMNKPNEAKIEP